jgi:hypothetical protein
MTTSSASRELYNQALEAKDLEPRGYMRMTLMENTELGVAAVGDVVEVQVHRVQQKERDDHEEREK